MKSSQTEVKSYVKHVKYLNATTNSIVKIKKNNVFHQCVWVCVSVCLWQRAGERESRTLTCFLCVCVFPITGVSIGCVIVRYGGRVCVCVCVYFSLCVCVCMCYCGVCEICTFVLAFRCCSWVWDAQESVGLVRTRIILEVPETGYNEMKPLGCTWGLSSFSHSHAHIAVRQACSIHHAKGKNKKEFIMRAWRTSS